MKRLLSTTPMIMCFLYIVFPFCHIIGAISGYEFSLYSYPISILVLAIISIIITVLLNANKISMSKTQAVCSSALLPLSLINGLYFILSDNRKAIFSTLLICCLCSIVLLIKHANPIALKGISISFSILIILFVLFCSFIDFIFGDIVSNTVVKTVSSPQNTYIVEVIDNNQGALGGSTLVYVTKNSSSINLLICKFTKEPIRLYVGHWGEFENMNLTWKDEHTLLINDIEYNIKDLYS